MTEYIPKRAIADALFSDEHMDDIVLSANDVCRIVNNLPAADVRPVVRGRWIKRDNMPRMVECKCSACGYSDYPAPNDRYWFERNFCPNCGADMREGLPNEK